MRKQKNKFCIGDVVVGGACNFVVEDDDLGIVNSPSNEGSYRRIGKKCFGKASSMVGKHVRVKRGFFGIFDHYGKVMRHPETGEERITNNSPWCLDCKKGISLSENLDKIRIEE